MQNALLIGLSKQMVLERQKWRSPDRVKEIARKHASILGVEDAGIFVMAMRELVEAP